MKAKDNTHATYHKTRDINRNPYSVIYCQKCQCTSILLRVNTATRTSNLIPTVLKIYTSETRLLYYQLLVSRRINFEFMKPLAKAANISQKSDEHIKNSNSKKNMRK
jgi:predicted nucleic-acid-binding Zn-ribbon protein